MTPQVAHALVLVAMVGYVTGAPVPNWLGLATLAGRDAIQLGDGCQGVVPGVNVLVDADGALQVVDPVRGVQTGMCTLVQRVHMSDAPCAQNGVGVCDVAFS